VYDLSTVCQHQPSGINATFVGKTRQFIPNFISILVAYFLYPYVDVYVIPYTSVLKWFASYVINSLRE